MAYDHFGKVACRRITTMTIQTQYDFIKTLVKKQCLAALVSRGISCNNGRWLWVFSFLFLYFGSWRSKVIQSGGCLHCCLCKHGGRHKAQENRSMAAEQEQHEPPRLISLSGAQINSCCSGSRWYIGCISAIHRPFSRQSNWIWTGWGLVVLR